LHAVFTTFDRHLLHRFLYAFAVLFIASVGLFAVVDGFLNLDDFQKAARDDGSLSLLFVMARHYFVQTANMLDMIGPTIAVLAVMATLGLVMKHGELHPLLAAGVPTYRICMPFVWGMMAINALMFANGELVIPRVANELQVTKSDVTDDTQQVDSQYDPQTRVHISASSVRLSDRTLLHPDFLLPSPEMVDDQQMISADSARYYGPRGRVPAGWLLKDPKPRFESLHLNEKGQQLVLEDQSSGDVFIASSISPSQLYNRSGSYRYLTTRDLLKRIQIPAGSGASARALIMHLHSRLTRPVITLIGVFLVVPLIARREKMSLVGNVAICMATLGLVYGLTLAGTMLGQAAILKPEIAAWGPLLFGGGLSAWLTGSVRT
jgi:lipopolysaccharide export system permease protein